LGLLVAADVLHFKICALSLAASVFRINFYAFSDWKMSQKIVNLKIFVKLVRKI